MVFKKLLASLGAGGTSVETILDNPNVVPGGTVQGQVHLSGGQVEQEIEGVAVALAARVEVDSGDHEFHTMRPFHRLPVAGRFMMQPGGRASYPFTLDVPWETPISVVQGQPLRGMAVGVSTEVEIARAVDKGDLDPVAVHPLPAQEALLSALASLGLRFRSADLEQGYIRGSSQQLPFYQEIEFAPAPQYASGMNQLEVTFLAGPTSMEVILEVDKRGGLLSEGRDTYNRFVVQYATASQVDWRSRLHEVLSEMSRRRGFL